MPSIQSCICEAYLNIRLISICFCGIVYVWVGLPMRMCRSVCPVVPAGESMRLELRILRGSDICYSINNLGHYNTFLTDLSTPWKNL